MQFLAVVKIEGDALREIAAIAKCTPYDARMRIAAGLPAVVARIDDGAAEAAIETLAAVKVAAVCVGDPVPSRADRLCAQSIGLGPDVVQFSTRAANTRLVRADEIRLLVRGVRSTSTIAKTTESRVTPSAKGGVRVDKVTRSSTKEALENLVLVYLADGACVEVAEEEMQWTSLGENRQLSGPANVQWVASELRRRAPHARYDESLLSLGKRTLPLIGASERSSGVDRSDTVDVIAAVLHRASALGLL